MVELATGASKRLHQSLQPSGRAMEPLARIDFFDFDDTPSTPTYCVDGVDTKPALIDEPRHDQLSHYLPSRPGNSHPFWRQPRSLQKHFSE
jgi:hypothetical protein